MPRTDAGYVADNLEQSALKTLAQRIITFGGRPLVRNVLVVASGTAAAQAITLAFSPIITRLYGPEAYGITGVFMSIAGIASAIAAFSYPMAIVLPRDDTEALGLMRFSLSIGIATSLLAAFALVLYGEAILAILNVSVIASFIYLIPAYMFISVVSAVAAQWLIRKNAFAIFSKVTVCQALLMGVTKVGIGHFYPTAPVLVATNTLGGLLGATLMALGWRGARPNNSVEAAPVAHARPVSQLAAQYRDFPFLRTPQVVLNALSHSLPVMLLATFFGTATAGFYSLAFSVVAVPAGLIGSSVMQVFYPRFTEAIHRGEDARALIIRATVMLALGGAAPFALLIAAGPQVFSLLFGAEWRTAGIYAQWLAVWLFFQCVNRPAVAAIPALRLQRGLLIYELFSSSAKVVALYIGYGMLASDVTAIALFSIFGGIAYVALILWVIRRSKMSENVRRTR